MLEEKSIGSVGPRGGVGRHALDNLIRDHVRDSRRAGGIRVETSVCRKHLHG